ENGIFEAPVVHHKRRIHPTQKPIEIISELVKIHSNENDIVLDCFMGSATTAVACELNNRKWIGFETESKYIELANKRLEQINLEDDLKKYR
ncbi:MAG TPA: site-specific DNA-methyltransferase, partial [Bacteroidales bacterium]|nr:site-specific DNA-methyltransferase [Bacteroidales bacterium]